MKKKELRNILNNDYIIYHCGGKLCTKYYYFSMMAQLKALEMMQNEVKQEKVERN